MPRGCRLVDATLMLQHEVAERLTASPGGREYGVLAILVQHTADVERLLTLPPGAFRPAPKVRSALVRIRFREARPACGRSRNIYRACACHLHAPPQDALECTAGVSALCPDTPHGGAGPRGPGWPPAAGDADDCRAGAAGQRVRAIGQSESQTGRYNPDTFRCPSSPARASARTTSSPLLGSAAWERCIEQPTPI